MAKATTFLGTLLVLQLLLAGGIFANSWRQDFQRRQHRPVLTFQKDGIDRITINGPSEELVLTKSSDGWHLKDDKGKLADQDKVQNIIERLSALTVNWPVASSPSSQEQFEVGDKTFQKKVRLSQGDSTIAELIIGSSPGPGKSYLRNGENSDIFTASMSSMELPTEEARWLPPKKADTPKPEENKKKETPPPK